MEETTTPPATPSPDPGPSPDLAPRAITCVNAYDLRGRVGRDFDADIAWRIGRAFAETHHARLVVAGRDSRPSSPALQAALMAGLTAAGADVCDLGLAGTEEVGFATARLGADGGITVTASHNPAEYNGLKLVGRDAAPLAPGRGVAALAAHAGRGDWTVAARQGRVEPAVDARAAYVRAVSGFVDVPALRPLRIVVNAGNGTAGPTFDALAAELAARGAPLHFIRIHHEVDPAFPNGVPNPMLEASRTATAEAVKAARADFGVAWDGDFDRCFLFDEGGRFIAGEYLTGLLATVFLARHPGERIVHDTRVVMNTRAAIADAGGISIPSLSGHAFMKRAMRESGAIYGGEMSAHHYFRDFHCTDSGMIPWLLVAELLGRSGRSLADLVGERIRLYPSSGESNLALSDPDAAIARVMDRYSGLGGRREDFDGTGFDFGNWRFNLRRSQTEPLVRLNVEGCCPRATVLRHRDEIVALLTSG